MTIDRMQSKSGELRFDAENYFGTTGTGSTIASLQYPGGFALGQGGIAGGYGRCGEGTFGASDGGGARYYPTYPVNQTASLQAQTWAASTGTISHNNRGAVLVSASAGGIYQLQPPSYDGQQLTLVNLANASASIVSTIAWSGNNATTTAGCPVIEAAQTLGSSGNWLASTGARQVYMAFRQAGQATATSGLPIVWRRIL